jgi:hypothetical protein
LYSDLDIFCNDSIESFFDLKNNFIASEEPSGPGYSQMIFAAEPGSIFLKNIINNIKIKYYQKNKYNNIIDYETNEVGYIIFTDSIIQTTYSEEIDVNTFMLYKNEEAKKIHKDEYLSNEEEETFPDGSRIVYIPAAGENGMPEYKGIKKYIT